MIDVELLEKIQSINKELEGLQNRLQKIETKENTVALDSVQGSSTSYPYIKHSCVIEGVQVPKNRHLKAKYRKMIRSKTYKLEKLKVQLEYELNYIDDPEIRDIIRYRYNDNKSWIQIMFLMGYRTEDKARKKLERFLKKSQNVRFVRLKHDKIVLSKKVSSYSQIKQKRICPKLLKGFLVKK